MKRIILFIILLCIVIYSYSQVNVGVTIGEIPKCKDDTIKGMIIYQGGYLSRSTWIEGYYIAPCGGYQITNNGDSIKFIPSYIIRNKIVNGKRIDGEYIKEQNVGIFVDKYFKLLKRESIYGMIVL